MLEGRLRSGALRVGHGVIVWTWKVLLAEEQLEVFEGFALGLVGVCVGVGLVQGVSDEHVLAFLDEEDAVFDRVFDQVSEYADGVGLAETMDAIDGLIFNGAVPPKVEQPDLGGGGEVEPDTAGLERDEEEDDLVGCGAGRLELDEQLFARLLRRGAVQTQKAEAVTGEDGLDQVEERGELRKDHAFEGALGGAERVEVVQQRVDFGR